MTPLEIILLIAITACLIFVIAAFFGRASAIDRAAREHRIALKYLAWRRPSLADEFASLFIDGNQPEIDRRYPDFADFRRACLDAEEDAGGEGELPRVDNICTAVTLTTRRVKR